MNSILGHLMNNKWQLTALAKIDTRTKVDKTFEVKAQITADLKIEKFIDSVVWTNISAPLRLPEVYE